MTRVGLAWVGVALAAVPGDLAAAVLQPATIEAFDDYVRQAEARMREELAGRGPFFWIEGKGEAERRPADDALRKGEILTEGKTLRIPDGVIHHWVGAVFIPGATLRKVEAIVTDYDNYQNIYRPDIARSKLLSRDGDNARIFLRLYKKKVLTALLNTEHEVEYSRADGGRAHSRTRATRIAEIEDPDRPEGPERPVGKDRGIVWRLNSYWRFAEAEGGTYVQIESVSLSRDVPVIIDWIVGAFIRKAHRELHFHFLRATRAGVLGTP